MKRAWRCDPVVGGMIVAFALLRVAAVAQGLPPVRFFDTPSYFPIDFLGNAPRLWTGPLLFNILPDDPWRVAGQVVLAVVAWGTLAGATAESARDVHVKRVGAAVVLIVGLMPQVTQWDLLLLSESTALSLTVLGTALALRVFSGRAGTKGIRLARRRPSAGPVPARQRTAVGGCISGGSCAGALASASTEWPGGPRRRGSHRRLVALRRLPQRHSLAWQRLRDHHPADLA